MSIMQDYEKAKQFIGEEKYNAIEKYLNEICPKENYDKYEKELNNLIDIPSDEWLKKKEELENKYGIIFLSDVLYKPDEWRKFEIWYKERIHTFIIELWENNANRENGFGQVLPERYKNLEEAIQKAKEIFETTECVSIEVLTGDREKVYYFRDKINEKYFSVEDILKDNKEELEEDEPI